MDASISEAYRRLNAELHASRPDYGASGQRWAASVRRLAERIRAASILDYGCGKQSLRAAVLPQLAWGPAWRDYDPAIPELAAPPEPADLVVCSDVLEHIEPDCLAAVLDDLRRCTRRHAFLVVATGPAIKTLSDGRNAHLIQQPPEWWLPRLMARWELDEFKALNGAFCCVMKAAG